MPPLRWQKIPYSSTTNRFICINLTKLTLASWLKLLPSNDVQARVRSHACFFSERSRLFVPDKVHSLLSRNYFAAAPLLFPPPTVCCNSAHITILRIAAFAKRAGVTLRAIGMFRWLSYRYHRKLSRGYTCRE